MIKAVILGILLGILSGTIPGIHVNTFSSIILAFAPQLSEHFTMKELGIVIFVNAIVHTFLDILPSTFLGLPDEDTAIAVLPTHELVLDGKGFLAVTISAYSSLLSFLLSIPLFFAYLYFLPSVDLRPYVAPILILVSIATIMSERGEIFGGSLSAWRKRAYAASIFLLSGVVGILFRDLMPMLTGFFSSPTLLSSMDEPSIPDQVESVEFPKIEDVIGGTLSGAFVSIFPGISSGIATLIASKNLRDSKRIVSAVSSANTSNALLCFAVFLSSGRVRSGAVDAFRRLSVCDPVSLIIIGTFSALAATLITISMGKFVGRALPKISPSKLSYSVFVFLVALIVALNGFHGLLVFSIATLIGILTLKLGVRRINCMGCIVIPTTMLYL